MSAGIFPHLSLHILLELKSREGSLAGIFLRNVLRIDLHDHAGVGEPAASGRVRHAIHHDGLRLGLGRHQDTSRTHAEREDAALAHLLGERIFRRGHPRLPLSVVADVVDQGLRMLHTDSHREALGLKRAVLGDEHVVDVPCRVAGGEDDFPCRIFLDTWFAGLRRIL